MHLYFARNRQSRNKQKKQKNQTQQETATQIAAATHNRRVGRLARLYVSLRPRFDRNGLISTVGYGFSLSVRPSVRLYVCQTHDTQLNGST